MRIGFVCGAFDLLHAGHIHLFKQAKQKCDYLVVGLHIDPSIERHDKNMPVESILERQIKINACKYVDQIIVYEAESDLSVLFNYYKIDVRFLGSDYKNTHKDITAGQAVPIEYIDSIDTHTSTIRKIIKKS